MTRFLATCTVAAALVGGCAARNKPEPVIVPVGLLGASDSYWQAVMIESETVMLSNGLRDAEGVPVRAPYQYRRYGQFLLHNQPAEILPEPQSPGGVPVPLRD